MKEHAENITLRSLYREMVSDHERARDEDIERLRWELDRAVSNLVEALMRREREQRMRDELKLQQQQTAAQAADDEPLF